MSRPHTRVLAIATPIVLGIVALVLSVCGWYAQATAPVVWSDLIYKGLQSIGLSDAYAEIGTMPADANGLNSPALALNLARWLGAVVAFWAVLSLFYGAIRTTAFRLLARLRMRQTITVGRDAFAWRLAALSAAHGLPSVHLVDGTGHDRIGSLVRMPLLPDQDHDLDFTGAASARNIVISLADDASAVQLAIAVRKRYRRPAVILRLHDSWLALHLHTLPGADKLRAFTEAGAAAREILRRHPPFLLAQDQGQSRLHLLLAGDPDWLEALMVETILSACTLTYGKPTFTFLTADPDAFRNRLQTNFPELSQAADTVFLAAASRTGTPLTPLRPDDVTGLTAVTAAYCALASQTESLTAAMTLRDLLTPVATFTAPIFVHAGGLPRPVAASALLPRTLVPFGAPDDIARATGLLSLKGEAVEKAWHKAYLAFAPNDKQAATLWDDLPEEFRVSNQRAVGHIYAKLFDAGFDLRPWLAAHDPWVDLPTLAKGEKLWRNEAERTRLAELEHERWTADRRMSGWRSGAKRDNALKIHDNIAPFEALTDEIKSYDYKFVDLLASILKPARDGLKRKT